MIPAALLLAGIGLLTYFFGRRPPEMSPQGPRSFPELAPAAVYPIAHSENKREVPSTDTRIPDSSKPSTPSFIIKVLSTVDESPVAGATVFSSDPNFRSSLIESANYQIHGKTDAAGILNITEIRANAPANVIFSATARGYFTVGSIDKLKSAEVNIFHVTPAKPVAIHCKDIHGSPLPGVIVSLSPIAIPPLHYDRICEADSELSGVDPRIGIHTVVTDSGGAAEFDGLPSGKFGITTHKPGYCKISGPNFYNSDSTEPVEQFSFGRLLAAIVTVEGDAFVSYSAQGDWRSLALDSSAQLERKTLESKYPSSIIFVGRGSADGARAISLKILDSNLNTVTHSVELFELNDPRVFQTVRLQPADITNPRATAKRKVTIADSTGAERNVDGCYLIYNSREEQFRIGPIRSGEYYQLPVGALLTPSLTNAILGGMLKSGGISIVPENIENPILQLNAPIRRCAFRFEWNHKMISAPAALYLTFGASKKAVYPLENSATEYIWLPVGKVKIMVKSFGIEAAETEVEVVESKLNDPQIIPINVELKRNGNR